MSEDGPSVACRQFGVGRRMKGATRMNPVITDCHFRSIGAAAGGRIATLAQSMGEWKRIITQIFFFLEYTQNSVFTYRTDLVPSFCYHHCF